MTQPLDQSARDRFAQTLDRNFSVVAAAGSGKTRAVTDRIAQLAQAPGAIHALPRLVVLTFANRAADEMQQRAREQILRAKPGPEILAAFNRAWFGTIHAFCLKLLNDYGHYLGLPAPLELITDDDDLWNEFVQQQTSIGRSLSTENRAALLRLASMRHIMELGRKAGSALLRPGEPCACPEIDLKEIHRAHLVARKTDALANSMAQLGTWEEGYRNDTGFLQWPLCSTSAKTPFTETWQRAFIPLRRWVNQTAICVAAEVQRDYRNFRLERGVVTYADQIALADELLQHPEAARRIRQLDPIVILDEAQDTDPAQFSILLEITRPSEAAGRWLETKADPPRPGRFCMVGDFQQSIYHDRADLAHYQRVHDALVKAEAGEAVTFSVTFRLDQKQLDFANATFGEILHNTGGQVKFVELQPRPHVLPGQVIRLSLSPGLLGGQEKLKDRQIARIEANELARWLKEHGPGKLRARNWREVAILCPRRDWLRTMAIQLRKIGLSVEVQSESDLQADSPAYAWLTALCTIMVEPQNHYEIVGVLREIYGLSDHNLAVFSEGNGTRFQIETAVAAAGVVSSQIAELTELRVGIQALPLFAAVEQLIERTALRARLASLPPEDFKSPLADLGTLLTLAAESGATGATLADFAERLRSEMERQRPVRLSDEDAIQLITAQKAKGSEWDAVVVPFLSRRITGFSPRYPSIIRVPGGDEVIAALHKEDREEEIKEKFKLLRRQEMERLLYVALTRARHTLVLAHDRALFSPVHDRLAVDSQLKFLRGDKGESSCAALDALPEKAEACAETSAAWEKIADTPTTRGFGFPPLDATLLACARDRASHFIHKHNPSGFDEPRDTAHDFDPPPAARTAGHSIADTPPTLYGAWWHALFEHFPWKRNADAWDAAFAAMQPESPEPNRSAREWTLLRAGTLADSVLTRFVQRAGVVIHTEFPFLWRMNEQNCMEGVIDLLAVDPGSRRCLVLDWKTNRIAAGEESSLASRYLSQLSAYWKAVGEITGFAVETGVHSTSTGRMLLYTNDDLAARWARLATISADALHVEIAPDAA
ncbi:MAG: UvrD-helicase domain-containing protein [Chthoniobacterales bacterium]|nr:UvrD-helicase domain-containing protein [Chthoniobacterales bacterium]